ncbi:hypothetical protein GAN17_20055 [Mycobacterium kubicae]|nr:hypothetical protein GAN17_20055 [Mycobacterium kubicae]
MSRTGANTFGHGDFIPRPLDMDELDTEASEFGWGPGLLPKGREDASPSEGGRYRGREATLDHPPERVVPVSRDRRI